MKKKTSGIAIIFAVIMSIILIPVILAGSVATGAGFSVEQIIQNDMEEELYQTFVDNSGIDWIYDEFMKETGTGVYEIAEGIEISAEEMFTQDDVEEVVDSLFHALIEGEEYYFDLSAQKNRIKDKAMEYFDKESENFVKEEMGVAYDHATQTEKNEILQEVKAEFEKEVDLVIEDEITAIEQELSDIFNEFYVSEEYQELKNFEEEFGYSLTDRTELVELVHMIANLVFAGTVVAMFLLVLCYGFRPAGFFVTGVSSLVIGVSLTVIPSMLQRIMSGIVYGELDAANLHSSIIAVIDYVLALAVSGLSVVAKYNLIAGVVIVLLGVLILISKKNKAAAE